MTPPSESRYLRPFSGYVPGVGYGSRVMGITNAKLTKEERRVAARDSLNYRHTLSKKAASSNDEAREWISRRVDEGVLQRVEEVVLVYRQQDGAVSAFGVIADVSLARYDEGLVKRHEATIAKSQKRMANYMGRTRVFTNPVALTHRSQNVVPELVRRCLERDPDVPLKAEDGSLHDLWLVSGDEAAAFCNEVEGPLYVTDGHHRLAAASSLAAKEGRDDYLPAGIFENDQLQLQSFARCFPSLPIEPDELLDAISSQHVVRNVEPSAAVPERRGQVAARIGNQYVRIDVVEDPTPSGIGPALDANLLQELILRPLIGVKDPRDDKLLEFIEATRDFDLDTYQAWFLPYPEAVESVLEIADRGLTMPPKSTLFGPKVPGGLAIRYIDGE